MSVSELVPPEVPLSVLKEEIDQTIVEQTVKEDLKAIKPIVKQPIDQVKLKQRPQVFGSNAILQQKRLNSQEMLDQLQHDPIEELVKIHDRLERSLEIMEGIRDGKYKGRFSPEYYNQTLMLLQKNNADLLRYKYARVSETVRVENENVPVLSIQLTTPETFAMSQNNGDDVIEHGSDLLKDGG